MGYVEETNAGNAIAALKQRLAPECSVCRNGEYVRPTTPMYLAPLHFGLLA